MRENFPYVGASYLFLIKDEKILLQRRYNTGFEDGKYGVPSGHLDGGESATEGLIREVKEEIGIDLTLGSPKVVHVMHRKCPNDERIDFFFVASMYQGEITNIEPHKCDDLSWFSLEALPDTTIPYVRQAIEAYQQGQTYSEFGW